MTVSNPDPDEIFYSDDLKARVQYVGDTSTGQFVLEALDKPQPNLIMMTKEFARKHLVTWTAESIEIEQGQLWERTRNDYADRRAFVLGVIEWQSENFIVYEEINSHGQNPKMKKEIDFRRVFGRLLTSDDLVKERALCRNCPHPVSVHDSEGCTITIPQTEDPDFGPTQTCPCGERGPR